MRVLLDECLPTPLKDELPGHDVRTAREAGLLGRKNGELLALASARFDVFVTSDRSLPSQQNLRDLSIAVVVLQAHSNSILALRPLVPRLLEVLPGLQPGQLLRLRA